MAKMSKRKQAEMCMQVELYPRRIDWAAVSADKLYQWMVQSGYYWNVSRKDWQSIKLTLAHIGSSGELTGSIEQAEAMRQEYLNLLVEGGILTPKPDGGYKRTKKIDLAGKYSDFGYGR